MQIGNFRRFNVVPETAKNKYVVITSYKKTEETIYEGVPHLVYCDYFYSFS